MLIPPYALISICTLLGIIGLVLAYKRRKMALLPVGAVVGVVGFTICRLRDPLALSTSSRHYTESWDYILWLAASFAIGVMLTVFGVYAAHLKVPDK
jgi:hypothetical protein